jgi:hypothetical protein
MSQTQIDIASNIPHQPEIKLLTVKTLDDLNHLLMSYAIDTTKWSKDIRQLFKEITEGETQMKTRDGKLERHTNTALVSVISPDGMSRLVEDRQEIKDVLNPDGTIQKKGQIKRRGIKELAEKFKTGEDPKDVARRALAEELGLSPEESSALSTVEIKTLPNLVNNITPKSAYEGLTTVNNLNRFLVRMPDEVYKPEGYVERQTIKTNYLVWKPIREIQLTERAQAIKTGYENEVSPLNQAIVNASEKYGRQMKSLGFEKRTVGNGNDMDGYEDDFWVHPSVDTNMFNRVVDRYMHSGYSHSLASEDPEIAQLLNTGLIVKID